MHKSKKVVSILAAATLSFSAFAFSGCGEVDYKGETLSEGYVSTAAVSSNGGFAVEKGDYVYFINGVENYSANNTYGKVVKGALMRVKKSSLAGGADAEAAQIVVPSLYVTGSYDSGIYIYGDYVYYATPTTDKNNEGEVANSSLDFKRAKIDGSEAPMGGKNDYFFRLSSNSIKYRYVEVDDVVYCMYEDGGALKSYNVATGKTSVLVSGASGFYYDTADLTNPNVYYTMGVTYDLDKENSTSANYNQIYCVNAAATATVDKANAKYTVKYDGKTEGVTYDFNEDFMKDNAEEKGYDLGDYTTYPYVNLGKLVLDGASKLEPTSGDNRYNREDVATTAQEFGYTYTLQQQGNGGIYFTRAQVVTNSSESNTSETAKLYYLAKATSDGADWSTIKGNDGLSVVSENTTNASSTALYLYDGTAHTYFYVSGTSIKKATGTEDFSIAEEVGDSVTLWKVEGEYLYYYGAGTNGKNISRVNYKGSKADYEFLGNADEYAPVTLPLVDWYDSWYKPEFVSVGEGATAKLYVLYANAQSFGSTSGSYNNIYAAQIGDNEAIKAAYEEIEAINEEIDKASTDAQAVMKYYFRTGETAAYEAVKTEYGANKQEEVTDFIEKFTAQTPTFKTENNYIWLIGRINEDDEEAIAESWENSLLSSDEADDEDDGLPTWAIVLIVVGSVLVVAAAALVPTFLILRKKKAQKAKEEAIVSAYKHKTIDTTDDKSIDVYEDETPAAEEESADETPIEQVEETPVTEETTEAEAPVEE